LREWRLKLEDGMRMGKRQLGGWLNPPTMEEGVGMEVVEVVGIMEVVRIGRVVGME
jgi:hypothetical protein